MMNPRTAFGFRSGRWLLVGAFVALVVWNAVRSAERKDSPTASPRITWYHPDPDHPWNRLHAGLFVRVGPDGKAYGQDRLEPLLWEESQSLLKGPRMEQAVSLLEEFLSRREPTIDDPLKRAMLQRDLWLIANWLAYRSSDERPKKLLELLAQAIHRLALTSEQISHLPDNYAAAVASKSYAKRFDPAHPKRAYLPPDVFEAKGPWVCVGRTDGRTAPGHLNGSHSLVRPGLRNPFTNSVFFVFLKLPGGREAGRTFLKDLARQQKPIFVPTMHDDGRVTIGPNRDLPVLPVGSELALVRRAMLIDSTGRIVLSPLTERVQLRVTTSEIVPKEDSGGLQEDPNRAAALEFELRRGDLFAGKAGGLRNVSEERDFLTGMAAGREDVFEVDRSGTPDRPGQPPFRAPSVTRRETCFGCHGVSTFYGTRSFQRYWVYDEETKGRTPAMYPVAPMTMKTVEQKTLKWKETDPGWKVLRELLRQ